MFLRFFEEGLAQASFLLACDRTRRAAVIDPRRDVSIYLAAARQHGLQLTHAIDTHVHADFVSGSHELAATGLAVICGPGSRVEFPNREVRDDEQLRVGDVTLTFLHTPGHTPEHITVRIDETGQPVRLCTGDLLFVGSVGRPDLLGEEQTRELASALFDSVRRIMSLDDDVEIHPGHGAGSLCGAGIGKEPSTTVGRERNGNALLRYQDRDAFIRAVLSDLPPTPPYFARMKRMNTEEAPLLGLSGGTPPLPSLAPAAAAALAADGAIILDLRANRDFAEAHPYGALNLEYGSKVGYWAGWLAPPDVPLLLLASDGAQAQEAFVQLLRVGLDRVEGVVAGGFEAWSRAGLPTSRVRMMTAVDVRDTIARRAPLRIVDVRTPHEWATGHIEGAANIPVGDLLSHVAELPREGPIATVCESGYRSMLAASLLAREGFQDVVNIEGGMTAYRAAEPA
jgi:hydroxyacylglutathione hydrolase